MGIGIGFSFLGLKVHIPGDGVLGFVFPFFPSLSFSFLFSLSFSPLCFASFGIYGIHGLQRPQDSTATWDGVGWHGTTS